MSNSSTYKYEIRGHRQSALIDPSTIIEMD